jgi:hypothetical protein
MRELSVTPKRTVSLGSHLLSLSSAQQLLHNIAELADRSRFFVRFAGGLSESNNALNF